MYHYATGNHINRTDYRHIVMNSENREAAVGIGFGAAALGWYLWYRNCEQREISTSSLNRVA